jgi:hypothetical protein
MEFSKTKINTAGQQFIQCDDKTWEDGMVTGRKTGFIEVKPEHADTILKDLKDGNRIATFGDKNAATNLYEMQVVKKAAV